MQSHSKGTNFKKPEIRAVLRRKPAQVREKNKDFGDLAGGEATRPFPKPLLREQRDPKGCILFDWGDTLMRDFKEFSGPMKDWPRLEAIPGAAEMLAALHPHRILAIATNAADSDEMNIRLALQRVDLDRWLDTVYCFKNIGYKKPSREFYGHILADLKLAPPSVCMVGDNYEADILGANACGIRGVWFKEHSLEESQAALHRTIHSLADLPEALKLLFP